MKLFKITVFLILTLTFQTNVLAETWDEPWQKEIIKKAEYFVLAEVINNDESIGAEVEIIKSFDNQKLDGKILINGFSLLNMTSSSGHGVHLEFEKGQKVYLLLTKRKDGNFAIPTPSSGFAVLDENKNVYAVYRHSYHMALVPQDVYEKTYTEIWNYFKTGKFEKNNLIPFINDNIEKKPHGFEKEEISTFFLQHVALETAYLLDISIELNKLKKFVESDFFHSRVSALQLLSNSTSKETKEYLFNFISTEKEKDFEKVIAIWSLAKIGGKEYKDRMLSIADKISDEETGFGGNIMDPRVGTSFPSPRSAIKYLK